MVIEVPRRCGLPRRFSNKPQLGVVCVRISVCLAACLALTATAAFARGHRERHPDTQGWTAQNVTGAGSVAITGTYAPAGETGSLQFTSSSAAGKADYVHALSGTLGQLVNNPGAALGSYDYLPWSTRLAPPPTTSPRRCAWPSSTQRRTRAAISIWEPRLQRLAEHAVTDDTFVTNDILGGNFWMRDFGPGHTVEQYGVVTLADWANGTTFPTRTTLSANTLIYSVEVGVGSGWAGTFDGAVDHVNVNFGTGAGGVSTNFELAAGAGAPEPASWALMILGFGGVGAALRRSRKAAAAATA